MSARDMTRRRLLALGTAGAGLAASGWTAVARAGGDAFAQYVQQHGALWPEFVVFNQQGNRWAQKRLVVLRPDGSAQYYERFSTTLQAPDFDFRRFPFDTQRFFIRVELIAPEWKFRFVELPGYSGLGRQLGEEEWEAEYARRRWGPGRAPMRYVRRPRPVSSPARPWMRTVCWQPRQRVSRWPPWPAQPISRQQPRWISGRRAFSRSPSRGRRFSPGSCSRSVS